VVDKHVCSVANTPSATVTENRVTRKNPDAVCQVQRHNLIFKKRTIVLLKSPMTLKHLLVAGVLAMCSSFGAMAALDINGVKVEESTSVAGTKLQLNGAGTRYKAIFKVYVGELYTTQRISSLDELIAAPGPKRLTMTFLREIEAGPFGKLLTRGVEDNVPKNEMSKLVPGLIRMGDIFTINKSLMPGDIIHLDWIPGTGMVVTAKGKVQGDPFKEPEFYKAIMSIWFGPAPADFKLKEAMLGQK